MRILPLPASINNCGARAAGERNELSGDPLQPHGPPSSSHLISSFASHCCAAPATRRPPLPADSPPPPATPIYTPPPPPHAIAIDRPPALPPLRRLPRTYHGNTRRGEEDDDAPERRQPRSRPQPRALLPGQPLLLHHLRRALPLGRRPQLRR